MLSNDSFLTKTYSKVHTPQRLVALHRNGQVQLEAFKCPSTEDKKNVIQAIQEYINIKNGSIL